MKNPSENNEDYKKTKQKPAGKTSEIVQKTVSENTDFCTSFTIIRKWQISIPIEPAQSELICAGFGPSQTTTEFQ